MKRGRWIFEIVLAALCTLGVAALEASMKQGVGIGGDSTIYLVSARNLTVKDWG